MPTYFNESDFASQQPDPIQEPVVIDSSEIAQSEALPSYANGANPNTPLNESPVSLEDRLKLSVGNEAGKIKFLQENYGEVQKTKSGDLVIKGQDGLWKRMAAEGLGNSDPWQMTKDIVAGINEAVPYITGNIPGMIANMVKGGPEFKGAGKEIVGKLADNAPMAANLAAQGAAASLTGGASLGLQAAAAGGAGGAQKGLETILGRALGTYQASDEQQLQDIAVESLLNAGGVYVGAGIKAGMPYIAKGLEKAGETLQKINPVSKNTITSLLGLNLKGGQRAVEQLIENPAQVSNWVDVAGKVGKNSDESIAFLAQTGAKRAEEMAKAAQPALDSMYDLGKRDVLRAVPQNFQPEIVKSVKEMQQHFIDSGVAKMEVVSGKSTIKFKTIAELTKEASTTGNISPYLNDPESYKTLEKMFNQLDSYANVRELKGIAGANQLLDIKKNLNTASQELFQTARDNNQINAQRFMASLKGKFDSVIYSKFDLSKPVESQLLKDSLETQSNNLLRTLDTSYSAAKQELKPLFNAVKASNNNPEVWNTLYNQLTSNVGSNQGKKLAFETASDYLTKFGGSGGELIAKNFTDLKHISAAASFIPNIKPSLVSNAAASGAVGSAAMGHPAVAGAMAASGVMASPKVNYHLIRSFLGAKDFIGNLGNVQRMQFLNNPQAVMQWAQTPIAAQTIRQQIGNELLQQGVGPLINPQGQ